MSKSTIVSLDTAAACIQAMIKADIPVMLWGPPGVGKSEVVKQIGAQMGMKVIDFRASLRDPVDLRGLPLVDETNGKTRWLPPDELPNAERDGETGILFMDEINTAPQSMQAACFGLVLDRYVGEYHLPKGWIIVAAGNRMGDRAAAQRMPTALRNRFAHFDVEADLEAWCKWANGAGKIEPLLIAFLRYRANLLHIMPTDDANAFPTPRAWAKVSRVLDAPEAIRTALLSSIVGEGPATECEGFIRLWKNLPPIANILRDPIGTHIPTHEQPAERYAVATALARKVTKETFANAITYVNKLDPEFRVIMVKDAVHRDPALKETEAFIQWALANKDVVL